jgi:GST-like protein
MYLGDKTGKFFPAEHRKRYEVIQWLMWQMGGVGPNFGQVHHFLRSEEARKVTYGVERYTKEMRRLYGVLNARLEGRDFICNDYSIADIATFPWVLRYEWQEVDLAEWPNVKRWFDTIYARPAVQKGITIPSAP